MITDIVPTYCESQGNKSPASPSGPDTLCTFGPGSGVFCFLTDRARSHLASRLLLCPNTHTCTV